MRNRAARAILASVLLAMGLLAVDRLRTQPDTDAPEQPALERFAVGYVAPTERTEIDVAPARPRELVLTYTLPPGVRPYNPPKPDLLRIAVPPGGLRHVPPREPLRIFFFTTWDCNEPPELGWHQAHYYHGLGIPWERMHVTMHAAPGRDRYEAQCAAQIAELPAAVTFSWWRRPFETDMKLVIYEEAKRHLGADDLDWIVHVDIDEFHGLPPGHDYVSFLTECSRYQISYVRGEFRDRVAADGQLLPLSLDMDIWSAFPLVCAATKALQNHTHGNLNKIAAHRGHMYVGNGGWHALHDNDERNYFARGINNLPVFHFKWVAGVLENMVARSQHFYRIKGSGSKQGLEFRTVANSLLAHGGRVCVTCVEFGCIDASGFPPMASPAKTTRHMRPFDPYYLYVLTTERHQVASAGSGDAKRTDGDARPPTASKPPTAAKGAAAKN